MILPGANAKELAPESQLLPFLIDAVFITAEDRFYVEACALQAVKERITLTVMQISVRTRVDTIRSDPIFAGNYRIVYEGAVAVDHSKDHIQVDSSPCFGNIDCKDHYIVLYRARHTSGDPLDRKGRCALRDSQNERSGGEHDDIATLYGDVAVALSGPIEEEVLSHKFR